MSDGGVDVDSVGFLRQMAALVPGIIYVFNHQTMSNEYSNRSIAELLGYSPEEIRSMGDELFSIIIHPECFDSLARHIGRLQDLKEGTHSSWVYRALRRDGGIVWLRSIDSVFDRCSDGRVLRHIGMAFDITAEKTAELDLRKLNAELEQRVFDRTAELSSLNDDLEARVDARTSELRYANKELEQLSYIAAHDLKAPIQNMSSLTDLLDEARECLPPEHAETLGWMHRVCDQATQKLDALVAVAQANAVTSDPFASVSLPGCFDRVLLANHYYIKDVGAVVRTDFAAPTVDFLQQEMEDMLDAFISNALKFRSDDRRLNIDVRSFKSAEGTTVTFADNGIGFDTKRDLKKVFGLFQSAHADPTGAGVSLYTISRIMKQTGGTIEAQSQVGVGTTIALHFPVTQPDVHLG
ncbi:MAG: ATP-binding protein [Roseobacter sp.]